MRKACLNAVYELAKQDERIVFIGSDLGAGVLEDFKREMPDRFFMEGIGEANMVGMAAGLALSGKIVYCHTIATFLTRRAFEQVAIDVGLHKANVRLIGAGGDVAYAPLGPTHLATDDIALMRTIPGMTILAPADAGQMTTLMPQTVNHDGPIYIRLGRGGEKIIDRDMFGIGQVLLMHGSSLPSGLALVTTGTTLHIALEVARSINATVVHVPTVKPINREGLLNYIGGKSAVITIEGHSIIGGLGSAVAEVLAGSGYRGTFKRIGFPDVFPSGYGTQAEMLGRYGISAGAIVQQVRSQHVGV